MGLGFSVGRGVRLHGGSRGLGVSVGSGPFRVYAPLSGGGRTRAQSGPTRTSIAAQERQLRQQQRLEQLEAQLALDRNLLDLCAVHAQEFPAAAQWSAPEPESVDTGALKRQLEDEALEGVSKFSLGERRQIKRSVAERLDDAIASEQARRAQERASTQEGLDRQWQALLANEPEIVLGMLENVFADNEMPAACVSCRDSRADILMRWPSLNDVIPESRGDVTPSGNPTIKKRPKTERSEFYLWALASNALATAKEAFAACPAIDEIGLAVVRTGPDPARGDDIVEPLFLGKLTREPFEGVRWADVKPIASLLELSTGRIGMKGKGSNKTLFGLEVAEPDEGEFIGEVGAALGCRVPDGGVAGIALPVQVLHSNG